MAGFGQAKGEQSGNSDRRRTRQKYQPITDELYHESNDRSANYYRQGQAKSDGANASRMVLAVGNFQRVVH